MMPLGELLMYFVLQKAKEMVLELLAEKDIQVLLLTGFCGSYLLSC